MTFKSFAEFLTVLECYNQMIKERGLITGNGSYNFWEWRWDGTVANDWVPQSLAYLNLL